MKTAITRRDRWALGMLALVSVIAFGLHLQRSGTLFYHGSRYARCRVCGMLQKQTALTLLGISIYNQFQNCSSPLAVILDGERGQCLHLAGLPVAKRELQWTTDSLLKWVVRERRYSDVGGLADDAAFLDALRRISRTNRNEARAIWASVCRVDYRSSNLLAQLSPRLATSNVNALVTFVHSEPVFEMPR